MSMGYLQVFSPCNRLVNLANFRLQTKSTMSSVGERIKERRQSLGWTQEKLATEAKMSTGFLSDLERGERNVSADYLLEISHALGVTLDFLMKGDSSTPKSGNVQIPAALSDFAKQAKLTFAQTLMLLDMQRQIIAHRSHSKSDDLEKVDWKSFHESMKPFIK
jgi:transcriptional regulator with XRE-family HTH domain